MCDELGKAIGNSWSSLRFNKWWGSDVSKKLNHREKEIGNNRNKIGQWLAYKSLNEKWVNWWLNFTKIMFILYGSDGLNWNSELESQNNRGIFFLCYNAGYV